MQGDQEKEGMGQCKQRDTEVGGHNPHVHREIEGRKMQVGASTGRLKEGGHRLVWCTGRLGRSYLCCL